MLTRRNAARLLVVVRFLALIANRGVGIDCRAVPSDGLQVIRNKYFGNGGEAVAELGCAGRWNRRATRPSVRIGRPTVAHEESFLDPESARDRNRRRGHPRHGQSRHSQTASARWLRDGLRPRCHSYSGSHRCPRRTRPDRCSWARRTRSSLFRSQRRQPRRLCRAVLFEEEPLCMRRCGGQGKGKKAEARCLSHRRFLQRGRHICTAGRALQALKLIQTPSREGSQGLP